MDEGKPGRLIVFDVEGVVLPERRFLLFEVARTLGLWGFLRVAATGLLYEVGLLSLRSALRRIFMLLRGLTVDDLFQLYRRVPLMPSAMEVFKVVKEAGYRTALISSGLPQPFVEDLAARLNADHAFGLELGVSESRLTGEVGGDAVKPNGKALILKKVLDKEGLSPQDCVVVADDRNNLPMFPLSSLRVGYNPDFLVGTKSDSVVRGDLSEILPPIIGNAPKAPRPILSRGELLRETIHISSFSVPLICMYLLNSYLVSSIILLLTLLYIASEFARLQGTNIPLFSSITRMAAIKPEIYGFVIDPVFFALGITLSLILFPEPANYASIATLTLGDGFATIFGKKLGRVVFPLNKGKRVEGSFFGFLFAFAGALLFVDPMKALVGAAVGMLVECLPLPISDNLTVPLTSGLAMTMIP